MIRSFFESQSHFCSQKNLRITGKICSFHHAFDSFSPFYAQERNAPVAFCSVSQIPLIFGTVWFVCGNSAYFWDSVVCMWKFRLFWDSVVCMPKFRLFLGQLYAETPIFLGQCGLYVETPIIFGTVVCGNSDFFGDSVVCTVCGNSDYFWNSVVLLKAL